jgi:hypothetical protein
MAEDTKKKKKPGLIEMGKSLYSAYMARRKQMKETMPETMPVPSGPETRIVKPKPPPTAAAPPPPPEKKKKKPRGGVGGVLDTIQERKRRMKEQLDQLD